MNIDSANKFTNEIEEKTELLWVGSSYNAKAHLGSRGLSVQFGGESSLRAVLTVDCQS